MSFPFTLPTLNGSEPLWQGTHFTVGTESTAVLEYSANVDGWNDKLTFFHEETAGDAHFIDRASRDHAIQQLKKHLKVPSPTILEIGCSSGFMLQRLKKQFPHALLLGSDIVTQPLKNLAQQLPGVPLFQFDLLQCPLPDRCVDAVVILNVLEHIEDDGAALKQIYRILKPGGQLIIEVPAGPHLFDIYDRALMHYRRYTLVQLTHLVSNLGFQISDQSHLGFFLYPVFSIVKKRQQKLMSADIREQEAAVKKSIQQTGDSRLLHALMQTELFLGRLVNYPLGIRALVTCHK